MLQNVRRLLYVCSCTKTVYNKILCTRQGLGSGNRICEPPIESVVHEMATG